MCEKKDGLNLPYFMADSVFIARRLVIIGAPRACRINASNLMRQGYSYSAGKHDIPIFIPASPQKTKTVAILQDDTVRSSTNDSSVGKH